MRPFERTVVNSLMLVSGTWLGQTRSVEWAFTLAVGFILVHALLLVYDGYTEASHE